MANNTQLNQNTTPGDIIGTEEISGVKYELVKILFGGNGVATKVEAANPLPVTDAAALAALLSIAGEDFATQTTLSALLAKVISAPSTEAKQDAMITLLTTIAAITQPLTDTQLRASAVPVSVSSLPSGLATSANQGTEISALASILAKIIAAPATEAKQDTQITALATLLTGIVLAAGSAIIGKVGIDQTTPGTTNGVQVNAALPAGNNNIGDVDVASIAAGSNIIGNVRIDQTTPGTTNNVTTKDLPDASSAYALSNATSTANEASRVIKASGGYLYMLTGYNAKTSSQFIQLFNSTTVPADTAVPVITFIVPASSNFSLDLGKYGRYFSTGIAISNSSTQQTKTIGTTDTWFDAQYI